MKEINLKELVNLIDDAIFRLGFQERFDHLCPKNSNVRTTVYDTLDFLRKKGVLRRILKKLNDEACVKRDGRHIKMR